MSILARTHDMPLFHFMIVPPCGDGLVCLYIPDKFKLQVDIPVSVEYIVYPEKIAKE
jgi:hypothetical protein